MNTWLKIMRENGKLGKRRQACQSQPNEQRYLGDIGWPVMPNDKKKDNSQQQSLSPQEIALERFKVRIGFYKFLFGTVLIGILTVIVPAAIEGTRVFFDNRRADHAQKLEAEKLKIETELRNAELELTKVNSQREFLQAFIDKALDQDIELRLRFSQYFATVSGSDDNRSWKNLFDALSEIRKTTREEIHAREAELLQLIEFGSRLNLEQRIRRARLERELEWRYREVGYVPPNRSVVRSQTELMELAGLADKRSHQELLLSFKRLLAMKRFGDPNQWQKTRVADSMDLYLSGGAPARVAFLGELQKWEIYKDDRVDIHPNEVRDASTVGEYFQVIIRWYRSNGWSLIQ